MPHDAVTGKVAPQPCHHPSLTASSIPHGRCASLMTPGVCRLCRWDGRFSIPVEGGALPRSQPCPRLSSTRRNTAIDLQKMNWKCRTGVNEQMGVSLQTLCIHTSIGGYTHADQDTGQYCHCSSLAHAVATGLSAR